MNNATEQRAIRTLSELAKDAAARSDWELALRYADLIDKVGVPGKVSPVATRHIVRVHDDR